LHENKTKWYRFEPKQTFWLKHNVSFKWSDVILVTLCKPLDKLRIIKKNYGVMKWKKKNIQDDKREKVYGKKVHFSSSKNLINQCNCFSKRSNCFHYRPLKFDGVLSRENKSIFVFSSFHLPWRAKEWGLGV